MNEWFEKSVNQKCKIEKWMQIANKQPKSGQRRNGALVGCILQFDASAWIWYTFFECHPPSAIQHPMKKKNGKRNQCVTMDHPQTTEANSIYLTKEYSRQLYNDNRAHCKPTGWYMVCRSVWFERTVRRSAPNIFRKAKQKEGTPKKRKKKIGKRK